MFSDIFYNDLEIDDCLKKKNKLEKGEIYSAILLLLGEEAKYSKNFNGDAIHKYVLKLTKIIEVEGYDIFQIYGGLTGIAYAINSVSNQGKKYNSLYTTINNLFVDETINKLKFAKENITDLKDYHYDIVSGISSSLGYLLLIKNVEKASETIKECLKYLVKLIDILKEKRNVMLMNNNGEEFINLGLAHGVSGILSLLAISYEHGFIVKGQVESIKYLLELYANYKYEVDGQVYWPEKICENQEYIKKRTRMGWCYGTPGIARSIFLGGRAIHSEKFICMGETALKTIKYLKHDDAMLESPTICHGYGSIVVSMIVMYRDTKNKIYKDILDKYLSEIRGVKVKGYKYEYKDYTYKNYLKREEGFIYKEDFSILTGCTGVYLLENLIKRENILIERMLGIS